jgi:hypothetical protein
MVQGFVGGSAAAVRPFPRDEPRVVFPDEAVAKQALHDTALETTRTLEGTTPHRPGTSDLTLPFMLTVCSVYSVPSTGRGSDCPHRHRVVKFLSPTPNYFMAFIQPYLGAVCGDLYTLACNLFSCKITPSC